VAQKVTKEFIIAAIAKLDDPQDITDVFKAARNHPNFQDPDKPIPRHLQLYNAPIPEPVYCGRGIRPTSTEELKELIKNGRKELKGDQLIRYDQAIKELTKREKAYKKTLENIPK
jgi:hypothetical protein